MKDGLTVKTPPVKQALCKQKGGVTDTDNWMANSRHTLGLNHILHFCNKDCRTEIITVTRIKYFHMEPVRTLVFVFHA